MSSSPEDFSHRLEARFPASRPKVTTFPSGAFLVDVHVEEEVHVVEYHPGFGYGVSRLSTATFGWEGVENEFESLAAVEAYVVGLLEQKKPIQPPQTRPGAPLPVVSEFNR